MRIERDVMVPTRDGAPIAVDVLRPDGDEPVPVIASMSPYGKDVHWPDRFPRYDMVDSERAHGLGDGQSGLVGAARLRTGSGRHTRHR
jgi:hypothetical protein